MEEKLAFKTVVVAYDLGQEYQKERDLLADFLVEDLGAKKRTESVYDFEINAYADFELIVKFVKEVIEPIEQKKATVCIWYHKPGKQESTSIYCRQCFKGGKKSKLDQAVDKKLKKQ